MPASETEENRVNPTKTLKIFNFLAFLSERVLTILYVLPFLATIFSVK